ncbi:rRNA methyltransferase [Boudabousia tangfeifanii]|uniref:rRNA methyltransferase n=1 Tax=Boudabousia tangfeifanii TaxID=1912795 RepID=A0A1D9MKL1_9ACTO|nr:RNA methyltransferase [Boudabousia tangfeifanii]AOZ72700.1 rRNA methyltransferase [Boudabousia tangfeifanii]
MLIEITDLSSPDLEIYTNLTDVALRKKLEPEWGVYLAESFNVMERAITAGHKPISFLLSPHWLPKVETLLAKFGKTIESTSVKIFVGSEETLEQLTGFHLHRGAIAAMARPKLLPAEQMLANPAVKRVLVLEDLVDHTNVGAAFRSAAALGTDLVLVTPNCADPFYRRSVRVSMGGVFQVPWTRLPIWPRTQILQEAGFHVAALALSDDSISLDEFSQTPTVQSPNSRLALIMGTEGDGLRKSTIAHADSTVRIPMRQGVDSLNVAAATAVALWETRNRFN